MAVSIPIISTFDSKGVQSAIKQLSMLAQSNKSTSEKLRLGAGVAGAAIVGGAVAAGVGLYKLGSQFDDAYDNIRVQTGATGDRLKGLEGDLKSVAGAVPASIGDAGAAVATLNQKLGISGQPLQKMSEQMLELSRITKTDLGSNLDSVAGVMQNFGVNASDQSGKLDLLFRASQQSGVSVADLAGQMQGAGTQLREVGLSFDQSAALLATLGKAGVDAGDVMPALGKAMATAAKEGKDASSVFSDAFNTIKNAPDDIAASQAAMDVFGAKAGPKLASMIREGKLSFEDMAQVIGKGKDSILGAGKDTEDFGEKFTKLKNKAMVALEPLATKVFGALGTAMDKIGPIMERLTKWFQSHQGVAKALAIVVGGLLVGALAAFTVSLFTAGGALAFVMSPITLIVAGIALLVAGVIYAWTHFKTFRDVVKAVWHAILTAIHFAWEKVIKPIWHAISWYIKNVLVREFKLIWAVVKFVFGVVVDIIQGAWTGIKKVFGWIKNGVKGVINIFSTIKDGIAGAMSGVGHAIWGGIKWGINKAIDGLNLLIKAFNTVTGWIPGVPTIPEVPRLRALGGSVTSNTPYLVGEQGPEVFWPDTSGRILGNSMLRGGGGSSTSTTVVQNITVNSNDPQAVVNALVQYQQRNGSVPIKVSA